jgi:hypothetical protein
LSPNPQDRVVNQFEWDARLHQKHYKILGVMPWDSVPANRPRWGGGATEDINDRLRADHKYRFFRAFRTWLRTVVNAYS